VTEFQSQAIKSFIFLFSGVMVVVVLVAYIYKALPPQAP